MIRKSTKLSVRIPKHLDEEYKLFGEENSIVMSKRIMTFIKKDMEKWKEKKLEMKLYENNLEEYIQKQENNKNKSKKV